MGEKKEKNIIELMEEDFQKKSLSKRVSKRKNHHDKLIQQAFRQEKEDKSQE